MEDLRKCLYTPDGKPLVTYDYEAETGNTPVTYRKSLLHFPSYEKGLNVNHDAFRYYWCQR
jgi:hypothetical protein